MPALHDIATALLRTLPPETGHRCALWSLAHGLGPRAAADDLPALAQTLWGHRIPNPIGIAAGFDKNAAAIAGALGLGSGFAEIGGVTPEPQAGNPRPRLFRLSADAAAINRMGFNNDGVVAIAARLAAYRAHPAAGDRPVGANLAANAASADPVADFERLVDALAPFADFLTIDISCPNTQNGQIFLEPAALRTLLSRVLAARAAADIAGNGHVPPALLAKLSPDVDEGRLAELVAVIVAAGLDGIIVANTTTARPATLTDRHAGERGGLSGRPLFGPSTETLRTVYRLTGGALPLVGVGGVASGADAYAKIRAGAALVQLYTALIYAGPGLIGRIKRALADRLAADGFGAVADAVGADHR